MAENRKIKFNIPAINGVAYFITGTDTNVGKTVTTGLLARYFVSHGFNVAVIKSVQTGAKKGKSQDLGKIRSICPNTISLPVSLSCPYIFRTAASPHLAAKIAKKRIIPEKIIAAFRTVRKQYPESIILVEGAGGLLVPLTNCFFMIDLIEKLDIATIVVASPALGTINHTLLSMEALQRRKIKVAGLVFNRVLSKPGIIEKDNMTLLSKITGVPVVANIPETRQT